MERGLGGDIANILAQRYSYYDLLRRIFLWEMPLELFEELVDAAKGEPDTGGPHSSPEAALKRFLATVPAGDVPAIYRDIQIEYTRLFLGPHHLPAPPYESVYRSPQRLMMQDSTMEVRAFYQKNGFRVTKVGQQPDDTLGIELEFMCALSNRCIRALAFQDYAGLEALIAAQRDFCDLHLCQWVPQFCEDIDNDTKSEFWKSVTQATRSFLEQDVVELNDLMNQLQSAAEPNFAGPM